MPDLSESDREQAQRLRREWMTILGCEEGEIVEMCQAAGCCDPEAEREHLDSAQRIARRNAERHQECRR